MKFSEQLKLIALSTAENKICFKKSDKLLGERVSFNRAQHKFEGKLNKLGDDGTNLTDYGCSLSESQGHMFEFCPIRPFTSDGTDRPPLRVAPALEYSLLFRYFSTEI